MHVFYQKPSMSKIDTSIQAETKCVMLLIQHNSFFNISDHLSPLIRREFRGSQAAENFSFGRAKTAAIVNCLGDHFLEKLKSDMQEMPYSLMLGGSNDTGLSKIFPIKVQVFGVNFNRVMMKFFDMNLIDDTDASTVEAMFQSIGNQFNNHDISWHYCLAICLHNTNVNIADHNSIKSRAKEKNGSIVIAGCSCHILHNALCKAGKMFFQVTNFDIEDHAVDLFHWFDKSSKQKAY